MTKKIVTSANTSINHTPSLIKKFHSQLGSSNLDWGGGKYDTTTDFMASVGKTNVVYDPYNRTIDQNTSAMAQSITSITCANVLNVIKKDSHLTRCLEDLKAHSLANGGVPIFFSVYPGDRTGVGTNTKKDCFQRNTTMSDYKTIVTKTFPPTQWKWECLSSTCFYLRRYLQS